MTTEPISTKLSRKKADREDIRGKVLCAVWEEFKRVGYSRLNFPAILSALGVTKGTIYYWWGIGWKGAGATDKLVCEAVLTGLGREVFCGRWLACAERTGERLPQSYLYDLIRRERFERVRECLEMRKAQYEASARGQDAAIGDLGEAAIVFGDELLRELNGEGR